MHSKLELLQWEWYASIWGTSVACPRDPLITVPVLSCMCRPNPTGMNQAHPGPSPCFWCYDHASPGPPTLM